MESLITVQAGDTVTLRAGAGVRLIHVGDETEIRVSGEEVSVPPPLAGNLLINPCFENPVLNGIGWQTADWPGWVQDNRVFMVSRRKDAEESPVLVPDAFEFDIDSNGGWSIGQRCKMWQDIAATGAVSVSAGLYGIHHVYGGNCWARLWGMENGLWYLLDTWVLRNADGSYNMPMATKTERKWRPIELSSTGTLPYIVYRLEIEGFLNDLRDGMKMSGAWLQVAKV